MKTATGKSRTSMSKSSQAFNWLGLYLIILGIIVEILGRGFVALTRESVRGKGVGDIIAAMNTAVTIQGIGDVLLLLFVGIGIALLVREYLSTKRKKQNVKS